MARSEFSGKIFFRCVFYWQMAEREGFEPPIPAKVYTLSRRAPSATRPSLRAVDFDLFYQEAR
jgi:hypothetical protein